MGSKILVVDDSGTDRLIICNMLRDFIVLTASDGLEAMWQIEDNPDIELIILDINMPNMDGFEVLELLRTEPKYGKLKTIILTNFDEVENEIRGLSLGAVDYIRKPVNIEALRVRIELQVKLQEAQKRIEQDNEMLDALVLKKTKELVAARDITIHALIGLLEVRNIESCKHTIRTQEMMRALCEHLSTKEPYKDILTEFYINELIMTTPLHDIGKVGIPDRILLKPSRLTIDEFEIMKQHVVYGIDALKNEVYVDEEIPSFIKTAMEIVGSHHERYDGTGYPLGVVGKSISLEGRLMAIIDVYDALMNERAYKPAYEHSYAIELMKIESGKHFDPDILEGFLEIKDKMFEIIKQYKK